MYVMLVPCGTTIGNSGNFVLAANVPIWGAIALDDATCRLPTGFHSAKHAIDKQTTAVEMTK